MRRIQNKEPVIERADNYQKILKKNLNWLFSDPLLTACLQGKRMREVL